MARSSHRRSLKTSLRISIFTRDNYTCQYCGRKAPEVVLHVEHIISVHDGGSNHPSNLVAACEECNYGKGKRSLIVAELQHLHPPTVRYDPNCFLDYKTPTPPSEYWENLMGALEHAHDIAFRHEFLGGGWLSRIQMNAVPLLEETQDSEEDLRQLLGNHDEEAGLCGGSNT